MIETVGWLRVGRDEVPEESTRPLFEYLARVRDRAHTVWMERYADQEAAWGSWHTMGLVGPFARWTIAEFETWAGFGRDLIPVLQHRLRYDITLDTIDPVTPPPDPPVLHGVSRVLTERALARLFQVPDALTGSAIQKLLNAEIQLRNMSLFDPPYAQTRSGWTRLLLHQGVRIEGKLPRKISIRPHVNPVSSWEVDAGIRQEPVPSDTREWGRNE